MRVLRGASTAARRFYQWLDVGDFFSLGGRHFKVTEVARERVGALGLEDARREGAASLDEWKRHWTDNLPRSVAQAGWNPDQICVRHDFEATDSSR
ncbi:hypothetical protein HY251_00445 [bacterium]|nr:hypothetical protein [bacterium]